MRGGGKVVIDVEAAVGDSSDHVDTVGQDEPDTAKETLYLQWKAKCVQSYQGLIDSLEVTQLRPVFSNSLSNLCT